MSLTTIQDLFREALSHWASGVTVVAARDETGTARGMTASSFSSVSLNPPLILICVDERARLLPVLEQAERFTVNLLSEGQQEESVHFSGKPAGRLLKNPPFPLEGDLVLNDALVSLICRRHHIHSAGDHKVIFGQVEKVVLGEARPPLVYYRRRYHKLR